jgi:hypothetical protein
VASPRVQKIAPSRALRKRVRRKALARKPSKTVGYAYSGDLADLPKVIKKKDFFSRGVRTVFIPETADAEDALKGSERFRRIRLYEQALAKALRAERVKALAGQAKDDASLAGIDAEAFQPSARARAILRGRKYAAEDLKAAGGAYSLEDVRALLNGISRQAVDKRVSEGALLAVPGPSGRRRFPTVQFNPDGALVKGLKDVQAALGFSSPWAVLNFLVNENDHLNGQQPIEVLRLGDVGPVVAAAGSIGVQGA